MFEKIQTDGKYTRCRKHSLSLSGSPDDSKESNLLRELKTSLDRARSETTDGYAASEASASLFFSETNSTRESSPHKGPRIVPIQIEPPHNNQNQNGFQRSSPLTSTPKLGRDLYNAKNQKLCQKKFKMEKLCHGIYSKFGHCYSLQSY